MARLLPFRMDIGFRIKSPPPKGKRKRRPLIDLRAVAALKLRRPGFWVGIWGRIITIAIGLLVVALLVGWVLVWAERPGGISMWFLILGTIGFTAIAAVLLTLQNRLQAHWRLRAAEAAFLTGISHSLRTPISGIRAAAQVLSNSNLDEAQRARLVDAIVHETRRLGLRVDNVLETGRLEVEGKNFAKEAVDLGEIVRRMAKEAEVLVEGRGGKVELSLDPGIIVLGDPRSLRLLIENVFDNAIKASEGAPDIQVTVVRGSALHALVAVTDHGAGFAEQDQGMHFRRYWRGDVRQGGMGLGLALARAVARGHGGEIHLSSEGPGQGAVAEIWLPLAEPGT